MNSSPAESRRHYRQSRLDITDRQSLAVAYPEADKGMGVTLIPSRPTVVGNVKGILLVLTGAVSFVLLIGAPTVANLLLARSTAVSREFANSRRTRASPARVSPSCLRERPARHRWRLRRTRPGEAGVRILVAHWPALATLGGDRSRWRVLFYTLGISVLTGIVLA